MNDPDDVIDAARANLDAIREVQIDFTDVEDDELDDAIAAAIDDAETMLACLRAAANHLEKKRTSR